MTQEEAVDYIKTEYARLDQICHVDTSGVDVSISNRMTRQLGCFTFKRNLLEEKLAIKISDKILDDEIVFLDVIRHEYAHAIVHIRHPHRKHTHDDVWKAACLEVGCEPKATRRIDGQDDVKSRPDKYIVRCKLCGAESKYRNESKVVKILLRKKRGQVVCRQCGGNKFELVVIQPEEQVAYQEEQLTLDEILQHI